MADNINRVVDDRPNWQNLPGLAEYQNIGDAGMYDHDSEEYSLVSSFNQSYSIDGFAYAGDIQELEDIDPE